MAFSENDIIESLKDKLGDGLLEASTPRTRRIFLKVKNDMLKEAVEVLVNDLNAKHLSTITGSDLGEEIELIYHFALHNAISICLKTAVPKASPTVSSIVSIVPGAVLYEREVHDLLGVVFEGHPDLSRVILPEGWPEGVYPLRKEYSIEELKKISKEGEQ